MTRQQIELAAWLAISIVCPPLSIPVVVGYAWACSYLRNKATDEEMERKRNAYTQGNN